MLLLDRAFEVLVDGGTVIITNLAVTSPDRKLMEHVLDWNAHHRAWEDIRSLFGRSRFGQRPVECFCDETGVTLFAYCTKIS